MSDADELEGADSKGELEPTRAERKAERKAELAKQKQEAKDRKPKNDKGETLGIFARIVLFFRQTVVELRKVIWPTRKELINYTWVVLVFVFTMAVIIGVLDFAFAKGVLAVFG